MSLKVLQYLKSPLFHYYMSMPNFFDSDYHDYYTHNLKSRNKILIDKLIKNEWFTDQIDLI